MPYLFKMYYAHNVTIYISTNYTIIDALNNSGFIILKLQVLLQLNE